MQNKEIVFAGLTKLLSKSDLRPGTAMQKIMGVCPNLSQFAITAVLADLAKDGVILGVSPTGQVLTMLKWAKPPEKALSPELDRWLKTLSDYQDQLTTNQYSALRNGHDVILGLSPKQQTALIKGLINLASDTSETDPYMLSAKHLLGSSKALDKLGKKIASTFLPSIDLSPRKQYVLTAGPEKPSAIVIIENMSNFTAFQSSKEVKNALAICSFGYGISTDKIGHRLLDDNLIPCPAVGSKLDLKHLFKEIPCYFWGDLDKAGLDIYLSLKSALPELKLSAAYETMAEKLQTPDTCHSYDALSDKKGQKKPRKTNDENVNYLMSLCDEHAVDQEAICSPWPGSMILQEFDLNRLKLSSCTQ
jgi:hypothetical protein